MELALSLGDTTKPFSFLDKNHKIKVNKEIGFCMGLGTVINGGSKDKREEIRDEEHQRRGGGSSDPPVQLDLLPYSPVPRNQIPSQLRFPWLTENLLSEPGSSDGSGRGLDAKKQQHPPLGAEEGESPSSPNSTDVSSFQMDLSSSLSIYKCSGRGKRDFNHEFELTDNQIRGGYSSRAISDEEENALTRKKLRLSKDQSAFLEESFKEHNTLNPKQKLALAKQLNLRPRQVEVWFQNRRARTKLKQTEVDCEYLKRCCETLTEENRRLQKELQELRALKTSQPFYMQLPATTLTMCPACERVATTAATATARTTTSNSATATANANNTTHFIAKPKLYPFTSSPAQQAAS